MFNMQNYISTSKRAYFINFIPHYRDMGGSDLMGKSEEAGQGEQREPNAGVKAELVLWTGK